MDDKKQNLLSNIIKVLLIIFGLIGGFYFIEDRIEKIVSDKLKDPEILEQIAHHVRPSLTFDHNGTIRTDSGASQFIKEIKVEMVKKWPKKIRLSPTEHLNAPPIIECLNYSFTFSPDRIDKSDWLYELSSISYFITSDSATP